MFALLPHGTSPYCHGLLFESCKKETVSFLLLLALMATFMKWKGKTQAHGRKERYQWNQPDILNTKEKQHQCVTLMMLKALEAMCEKFKKQECHSYKVSYLIAHGGVRD